MVNNYQQVVSLLKDSGKYAENLIGPLQRIRDTWEVTDAGVKREFCIKIPHGFVTAKHKETLAFLQLEKSPEFFRDFNIVVKVNKGESFVQVDGKDSYMLEVVFAVFDLESLSDFIELLTNL